MTDSKQKRRDARQCAGDLKALAEAVGSTTTTVVDLLLAELEQADKLAEAIRMARSDLWWFIANTDDDEVMSRAMAIQDEVLYPALAQWAQGSGAAESIRSTPGETPANQGVKAPSGFEPLFQSAEPKADT